MVVIFLGLFALGGLAATVWLISVQTPASAVAGVSGMTGTSLGAFTTLLASTRSEPVPTTVVNPPSDPIPVEAA